MNINEVVATGIYNALITNTTITSLVTADMINRIWLGAAPPKLVGAFPYILMSYASGGLLNDAPYEAADITFLVSGVNQSIPVCKQLDDLIGETLRRNIISFPEGWVGWSTVRQMDAFSRVENVQNAQYFQYGNYYRFRLSKGL